MDLPGSNKSYLCEICNSSESKYTCPRCDKRYCTSECYKSEIHVSCSEEFYKEWVEAELKSKINDPDDTIKIYNILKRDQESFNNQSDDYIDSDDDDSVPDLADRIGNIDINNSDDIWAALTDAERQEFKAILYNEQTDKILPQWVPWWSQIGKEHEKLVEDLDDVLNYKKKCPDLVEIPNINGIEKASPLLSNNLINIIAAYIVMVLHYNGEHQESFREATEIYFHLNDVIGSDKVFYEGKLAAEAVIKKSIQCEILPENSSPLIITYVNEIIKGLDVDKTYYLKALLSDLYVLIEKMTTDNSNTKKPAASILSQEFKINSLNFDNKLTKKHLKLCLKKIKYYLAWVDKFGVDMESKL